MAGIRAKAVPMAGTRFATSAGVALRTVAWLLSTALLAPLAAAAQPGTTGDSTSKSIQAPQQDNDRAARYREMAEGLGWKGFTPTVGVVASGSGLAAGVSFASPALAPLDLSVAVDTSISVRNYQHLAARVGRLGSRAVAFRLEPADSSVTSSLRLPGAASTGWALYVEQRYRHLPSLSLFGSAGAETVRADFGQRLRSTDLVYQWQFARRFGVAARVSWLTSDIFAGTNDDRPNAETVFARELGLAAADGARYVATGVAAGWDLRDTPGRPQRGGALSAGVWRYSARAGGLASFTRLTIDGRVYRRVLSTRHVLAGRLVGSYSTADGSREIPFTMLQSLGGSSSLRSFVSYRFRGRHLTSGVVESRWRLKTWLEVVPFADIGRLAGHPLWPQAARNEVSVGIGARLWLSDTLAVRAELGTGSDGPRLVATLDSPF